MVKKPITYSVYLRDIANSQVQATLAGLIPQWCSHSETEEILLMSG